MKYFVALASLVLTFPALATDRIVEEFGQPPAYASINAAVTAAVDGDRIIVKNRAGNIPWIEDVTVGKNLQFLSYSNDDFFYVQGTYTIPGATGREVTIISMRNTAGGISGPGGGTTRGTRIRILDSYFVNGSIACSSNANTTDVVGCTLVNGTIAIAYGNVVGCDVDGSLITDETINVTGNTAAGALDTCAIIGNRVKGRVSYEAIRFSGDNQIVHIRNNYVQHGWMGIQIEQGHIGGTQNLVWNNTVVAYTGQFTTYGIDVANTNAGSVWELMNNVVTTTWSGDNRGINKDSGNNGQVNVYFNHVVSGMTYPISPGFTFESNNTINQPITLNVDGTFSNAPACVDGGNPAVVLSDLDLSTGDAGAYGGSYTQTNFHPLHTGAARVHLTGHPFNVRSGSTLRVKATAFDR
ncbi:MAG: hypothetical protein KA352_05670 [Flavobacteriales bacterium]|nr:hypothetical protein [Flavobacteriales bacterium]